MSEELKRCKYCNGKVTISYENQAGERVYSITCMKCFNVSGWSVNKELLIDLWNSEGMR